MVDKKELERRFKNLKDKTDRIFYLACYSSMESSGFAELNCCQGIASACPTCPYYTDILNKDTQK